MLTLIDHLPPRVLGVEASGTVTHADYRDVLIPRAEAMLRDGRIRMLYVIGADVESFEIGAMWDDGVFGIRHWRDFDRIALVGDQPWLRASVGMFRPLFPCEVRLFALREVDAAKAWISQHRGQ